MRNYFCSASYRKIVGADSISARYNIVVLSHKNTVGDGSPVPRRKAFSDEFGIICIPQITAKMQITDLLSYTAKCLIKNDPVFNGFIRWKQGRFVCEKFIYWKSHRDSGRENRPLQKIAVILCVANGRIWNPPLRNFVLRDKSAEQY